MNLKYFYGKRDDSDWAGNRARVFRLPVDCSGLPVKKEMSDACVAQLVRADDRKLNN